MLKEHKSHDHVVHSPTQRAGSPTRAAERIKAGEEAGVQSGFQNAQLRGWLHWLCIASRLPNLSVRTSIQSRGGAPGGLSGKWSRAQFSSAGWGAEFLSNSLNLLSPTFLQSAPTGLWGFLFSLRQTLSPKAVPRCLPLCHCLLEKADGGQRAVAP